ncbi:4-amino-4-deoxy-L-arabinose transferase-like glycosyltransferase [Algoriphagus sp. 4150]|uniref:ArnT family glycosyltransferase n=1 Tax=Algoriphagus sp. 4150 TaxID=2817756 RepID=UPI002864053F|nr:glycosyltransferase family 39 protein [Algoriphagus sp. 4150]MDR7129910.1 4-amino-4-deoxy-L-arabinose transferase-like glycosyltransferase [Algoriphagus sp. 4150]
MRKSPNYTLYFWLVSIGLVIAKILFTLRPEIDLFTEEAQYWLWSQNMAWHYYSKPPLIAVLNYLSTAILGNTELGVRFNAFALGLGMSWVTFRFASHLYSKRVGFWSAMILCSMPMWWQGSTFHVTDTSLSFCWILAIYLAYLGVSEGKTTWWIWAGVATAFGLMAKVVMVLIFPFLLIYLIYTHNWKAQNKNYFLFLAISLIGFLPALIWNWQNNFDTFRHLAALGTGGEKSGDFNVGKAFARFLGYLGGQLAMVSVFLLPLFIGAFREVVNSKDKVKIYLILPAFMSWAGFALLTFFAEIEVNWPEFSYSSLSIVMAAWVCEQNLMWRKVRNWAIGLSIGLPLLLFLPDFTFLKSIPPVKKVEKSLFRRLSGYQALADRLVSLRDSLGIEDAFVFSETYHMASELSFYLPDHPQTYMLNMGSRKNQFDLWPGLEQFVGKDKIGIFVSWNFNSPGEFADFQELLYEEELPVTFQGEPLRIAKIQVWRKLEEFNPYQPDSY